MLRIVQSESWYRVKVLYLVFEQFVLNGMPCPLSRARACEDIRV